MEIEKAIEIVEHYQRWRTRIENDVIYSSKELTEAINVLLEISNAKIRRDQLNNFLKRESEETKDLEIQEAAEHYAHNNFNMHDTNNYQALKQGYEMGATIAQHTLFNDEDMRDAYSMGMFAVTTGRNFKDWFSQYKKK